MFNSPKRRAFPGIFIRLEIVPCLFKLFCCVIIYNNEQQHETTIGTPKANHGFMTSWHKSCVFLFLSCIIRYNNEQQHETTIGTPKPIMDWWRHDTSLVFFYSLVASLDTIMSNSTKLPLAHRSQSWIYDAMTQVLCFLFLSCNDCVASWRLDRIK